MKGTLMVKPMFKPMFKLVSKMKLIKAPLKVLNASTFGDVHQRAQEAYQKLLGIQADFHLDIHN